MYKSLVIRQRVAFDPSNREHIVEFAEFLNTYSWKSGCRFLLEEPYCDIPSMCKDKLLTYMLKSYAP